MSTRRAGAVLAFALVGAALLTGVLPLPHPVPGASAAGAVKVVVTTLSPAAATRTSTLQVAGTISNGGAQVVRDAVVQLRLSQTRLNSRAELAGVIDGEISSRDGEIIAAAPLADLAPGASAGFDLRQPLDVVTELAGFGVYALGIEVVGTRGGDTGRVALTHTMLPWTPPTPDFSPAGFSWVWPLVAAPGRLTDGTFTDDSLATDLAPGGRLARLLEAGRVLAQGAALTWAIDPELIEAVAEMADDPAAAPLVDPLADPADDLPAPDVTESTGEPAEPTDSSTSDPGAGSDGYLIRTPDGTDAPGGGGSLARAWLDTLRIATAGADVLVLPYADPDLVGLVRQGRSRDLPRALEAGSELIDRLLPGALPVPGLAWPVHGFLDRPTLSALERAGTTSVVLDGAALPPTLDLSYTPSGHGRLTSGGSRVEALLADPELAALLRRARPETGNPVLAAQRIIAETAMITSELPNTGPERTVVAMPPRRWNPSQPFLDQLVGLAQAPWAAPVDLTTLRVQALPEVDRTRLTYPPAQRRAELAAPYASALGALGRSATTFTAILTDRSRLVPALDRARWRLQSSYWRDRDERVNRLAREQTYLSELRNLVRVAPGSFTFGSKSGKIPLTLVNDLPQEVLVVLRLEPQTLNLRVTNPTEPLRVGPNQKVQIEVDASAVAGGPVVVQASLLTVSGVPYGQPVPQRVNVTQIGALALVITVAAAGVLFLAAGIRVVRRVRAARRTAEADPTDPPDPSDAPDAHADLRR